MNDTWEVVWSEDAADDLRGIYRYIAFDLKAKDTAERQIRVIKKAAGGLSVFPGRHEVIDGSPWANIGMRSMPVGHYRIYYFLDEEGHRVVIDRVFFGGQNIQNIYPREGR